MSHQAGIKNTVAISGTAATDEHMKILGRFTDDIAIALDADNAGLVAAQKTAIVAYRNDMKVSVIDIPNGKDPADTIAENPEFWKTAIKHRKDFITFRLEKMKVQGGDKLAIAKKELFPILREFKSQIRLDDKMQEIAFAFKQSSVDPVRKDFEEFLKQNPLEKKTEDVSQLKTKGRDLLGDILGTLLLSKSQPYFEKFKSEFETQTHQNVSELLEQKSDLEKSQLQFAAEQMVTPSSDEIHQFNRFRHLILQYRLDMLEADKKRIEDAISENPGDESHLRDLSELLKTRDAIIHQLTL
jgi:DNA primase